MNEVLQETVTGESAVLINLGEKEYPLAFPLHACALYQRETAKLDRARRSENGRLTAAERQQIKEQRRELLRQADEVEGEIRKLPPDAPVPSEQMDQFWELAGEATALKNQMDEDAAKGDSLFLEASWFKINSDDPDRVVLALWAGLHQPRESLSPSGPVAWVSPFTVAQLRRLVDPSNAEEVVEAIGKALRAYAVKKKVRRLAASRSTTNAPATENPPASPNSGPSPESISDSPNPSS